MTLQEDIDALEGDLDFEYERVKLLVGEEIVRQMKQSGLRQDQLADRAGKPVHEIGHILSGHRNPMLRTLVRLANAMGCRVDIRFRRRKK